MKDCEKNVGNADNIDFDGVNLLFKIMDQVFRKDK